MTRPQKSMDGFVPRRAGVPLGSQPRHSGDSSQKLPVQGHRPESHGLEMRRAKHQDADKVSLEQNSPTGLRRADIDKALASLEEPEGQDKKRSRRHLGRPKNIRGKLKKLMIVLLVIGLGVGGWLGYKALSNLDGVFQGGLFGLVQKKPLKQDANGRSNVLIFGTSEDSPDHNANNGEGGPLLTDSIMVLSVNQEKKDAFMVSIPRDLWVQFDEPCSVGYQQKINSVYQCGSNFGEDPEAGAAALQKKVGEILGLDIQYYGQIDYSVFVKAVDAVGGVEVKIESNPPGVGILDRNFDWKCNYQCYYVRYDDGEIAKLDGEHALALARARNAQGGYGLQASNFDREKNQQKILMALREKALSVGTLTNIGKVTALLDAMGDNLKTSVETSEIQTIMGLATEIGTDSIKSLDLNDKEAPLVTTSCSVNAGSVCPVAGLFDYSQIQAFIARHSSSDPVVREGATIAVLNGSGVAGLAQREADWLEEKGFMIRQIGNAPDEYASTQVYRQAAEGMGGTKAKLESLYGVTVQSGSPSSVSVDSDFIVIIGTDSPSREPEL